MPTVCGEHSAAGSSTTREAVYVPGARPGATPIGTTDVLVPLEAAGRTQVAFGGTTRIAHLRSAVPEFSITRSWGLVVTAEPAPPKTSADLPRSSTATGPSRGRMRPVAAT